MRAPIRLTASGPGILSLAVAIVVGCDGDSSEAPTDTSPPPRVCASDLDCEDGLACTVDRCVGLAEGTPHCAWEVAPGSCFIAGVCVQDGEARVGAPCEVCDASAALSWTLVGDERRCDDGDACTVGEVCRLGVCEGEPLRCDDGDPCTRDACESSSGCVTTVLAGFSCDDGDRCTLDDRCLLDGRCAGLADPCDDGDPCTSDLCDAVNGCTHSPMDGLPCEDGDACVESLCRAGTCTAVRETVCDDGNACTLDTCDSGFGCAHLPTLSPCCVGNVSICDDQNPCTADACDPNTFACTHTNLDGPCDDGDVCTSGEVCREGRCDAGLALACDDANPCTRDACNPELSPPCVHSPITGPCDDGIVCTTGDTCTNGRCRGDTSQCVCEPALSDDGVKLTVVQLGTDGTPGQGLDVDQDPTTCAPSTGCSAGIDNTLSILAGFANPALSSAVSGGDVMLVAEVSSLATNPITVSIYQARLAPGNAGCDFMTATCDYLLDRSFFDPATCEPVARLSGVKTGNRLVAGGPGTRLPFAIPFDGADLEVVIANLRLEVDLTVSGGKVVGLAGVLGGAVPKQTLIDGLRQVPDESLPAPKEAIISLVESLVVNDVDTDGDGIPDSASIGVRVVGIDARLVGLAP